MPFPEGNVFLSPENRALEQNNADRWTWKVMEQPQFVAMEIARYPQLYGKRIVGVLTEALRETVAEEEEEEGILNALISRAQGLAGGVAEHGIRRTFEFLGEASPHLASLGKYVPIASIAVGLLKAEQFERDGFPERARLARRKGLLTTGIHWLDISSDLHFHRLQEEHERVTDAHILWLIYNIAAGNVNNDYEDPHHRENLFTLVRSVANQNVGSINKLQAEARTVEGTLNSYTQLVRQQEGKVARAEFARDTTRRGGLFKGSERKSVEAQLEKEQAFLQEIIEDRDRFIQSRQHVLYLNNIFETALS